MMTRSSILLLAGIIALAGCAVSAPPPQPVTPSGPETVLVTQPAEVPTYSNVNPPKGAAGVTLWGPVEKLPSPPTAVTTGHGEVNITIDSASIPGNVAARGGLGTIVLGYSFPTPVRAAQYRMRFDLRVTQAFGIAQVVAYFNLRDRVSGKHLWLGQVAFDTRCNYSGGNYIEAGTGTPIRTSAAPYSSCFLFSGWRSFSFIVGPAQIAAAVAGLPMSQQASDYELTHTNINPETASGSGNAARIDLGIRGWQISTQP